MNKAETAKATHTPGPWQLHRAKCSDNVGGYDYAITDGAKKIIAEAYQRVGGSPGNWDDRPALANARLIAAAPDLLAACERLERAARGREATVGDMSDLIDAQRELRESAELARAAIAKARPD